MLPERALSGYFRLLTFTGVLPISLQNGNNIVSTNFDKKLCFLAFFINNILILIVFIYISNFQYNIEGETVQDMNVLEENLMCLIHILIQTWFFFHNKQLFDIVNKIFKINAKLYKNFASKHFISNFKIFVIYNLVYHFYSLGIFTIVIINSHFLFESFLTIISHDINFLLSSLILSFYTCLIEKIQYDLFEINNKLDLFHRFDKSVYFEIQELLKIRNCLLKVCKIELSSIFGIPIILITIMSFLLVVHEFSLSLWIFNGSVQDLFLGVFIENVYNWIGYIVFMRAFSCNRLRNEVRIYILILI